MACEQIIINGRSVTTLKELLRPGLRVVVVGVNPALKSVSLGHYWQGLHGKLMWGLLADYRVLQNLRAGREDDDAFVQGIGLADLIRLPSKSSADFSRQELRAAVPDLLSRLSGVGRVPIILRYKAVADMVGDQLRQAGHDVFRMPSPPGKYSDPAERRIELMQAIQRSVGLTGSSQVE